MSNEQLLIYIYGIYPEGGISVTLGLITVVLAFAWMIVYDNMKGLADKILNVLKPLSIITASAILLGYFVPTKNAFLLMVATPQIMQSLENGKLSKLDGLLDKALEKANEELDKEEK